MKDCIYIERKNTINSTIWYCKINKGPEKSSNSLTLTMCKDYNRCSYYTSYIEKSKEKQFDDKLFQIE